MLAAHKPFVVPMEMRISKVKLRGIVVLVVDKEKGVTLVFKNDPLEGVVVNSTFDDIPNIQRMLQNRIEAQFRRMFQTELPQMIHTLSKLFLEKNSLMKKSSSEMNLRDQELSSPTRSHRQLDSEEYPDSGYYSEYHGYHQRPHHHKVFAN